MLYQDDKIKKSLIKILIICLAVSILLPTVNAAPSVWSNTPKTDKNSGETFELRFEILAFIGAIAIALFIPGWV